MCSDSHYASYGYDWVALCSCNCNLQQGEELGGSYTIGAEDNRVVELGGSYTIGAEDNRVVELADSYMIGAEDNCVEELADSHTIGGGGNDRCHGWMDPCRYGCVSYLKSSVGSIV